VKEKGMIAMDISFAGKAGLLKYDWVNHAAEPITINIMASSALNAICLDISPPILMWTGSENIELKNHRHY
jgi:hypothetical protein